MSARSFDINVTTRKQSNIRVIEQFDNQIKNVLLHGYIVVSITKTEIFLSSCGYLTVTTKTAINQALRQLGRNERVNQVKGQWFIDGVEFKDGMSLNR
jgi:Fe-S cluster biogenesis protein NfuA